MNIVCVCMYVYVYMHVCVYIYVYSFFFSFLFIDVCCLAWGVGVILGVLVVTVIYWLIQDLDFT